MATDTTEQHRTLDPDTVRWVLDEAKNQFVTATFIKKDGTLRTVNGQLRAKSRLVGSGDPRMRERGQVWIALPDGTSRSFFVDRVVGLRALGREHGTVVRGA